MGRGPKNHNPDLNGLLVVDKPLHLTSMDVVRRVRRAAGGAKVGHGGTLDPLATGVLICLLGKGTRAVETIMGMTKVYDAEVDLSAFTTTDDREGERVEVAGATDGLDRREIEAVLPRFIGRIEQTPPAYSAVHVGGQRAYALARRGVTVEMPTKVVRVDSIEVLAFGWPALTLRITCGRGTYIRSLARDLGAALGTGGHLASLRRTRVGPYAVEQAMTMERVLEGVGGDDLLEAPAAAIPDRPPAL